MRWAPYQSDVGDLDVPPLFHEQQRFRQVWLWLLFGAITLPLSFLLGRGVHQQLILGRPFGDHPVNDVVLVAIFVSVIALHAAVIALFWMARLDVAVTPREVSIRFVPFHRMPRRIPLAQVSDVRARRYSAIGEYGGWGIRVGLSGRAYNVFGDHGVQLTLADGKRILIGSQRSEELEAAIRRAGGVSS